MRVLRELSRVSLLSGTYQISDNVQGQNARVLQMTIDVRRALALAIDKTVYVVFKLLDFGNKLTFT